MKFNVKKGILLAFATVIALGGLLGGCGKKDNSFQKVKDKNELVSGHPPTLHRMTFRS